jgi:hypothetical protein
MKPSTKSLSSFTCIAVGVLFMVTPALAADDRTPKEWALLTYLNGFNSLDNFGYYDMNEMEVVGSTARVHVISQWASLKTREVHRIYVNKDTDKDHVTSPVIQNLGLIDMGDYRSLIDFVVWAAKTYPADHYFVNVWNHGNGWHFKGTGGTLGTLDLSYDDISKNHITTEELGVAMAEISRQIGKPVDLLGSDSCMMAAAEVIAQVKGSTTAFVGSEEVEPAAGWPYDTLLTQWNAGGSKSAADVSDILAKVYKESYPNGRGVTLSGMDLSKYGALATAVRDLGDEIKSQPKAVRLKIRSAVSKTRAYTLADYKDLGDLVDQIGADTSIPIRPEILAGVRTAISTFVTANQTTPDQAKSHGVSIWFPDAVWQFDTNKDRYKALIFNQDTAWYDAIDTTVHASSFR